MTSRSGNRIRAYRYIIEHVGKANQDLSHRPDKMLADVNYISLAELVELREGTAEPSKELVTALKKLLNGVASESEIEDYLVSPFLKRT